MQSCACLVQVCLYVAATRPDLVHGLCLLNCSGAMNQRGLYQDSLTMRFMMPVFALLEALLKREKVAAWAFKKFK